MPLNLGAIGKSVGPYEHAYDWDDPSFTTRPRTPVDQLDFLVDPEPKVLPSGA